MAAAITTPLWQLRSLQNWARAILIKELCPSEDASVVQIGGGGFDLGKWERAHVKFLLNIDSDDSQSAEAEARWVAKNSPFMARFLTHDFNADLRQHSELLPEFGRFSMIMSTDVTLERYMCSSSANLMGTLTNISNLLVEGGFFVGTVFDSAEIWNHCIHTSFANPSNPKSFFFMANSHMRVDFPKMAYFTSLDESTTHPSQDQSFSSWLPTAPTLGIQYSVNMEQKVENLFLVHTATLTEAAKLVGLKCLSFRNLIDFYDTFKLREEDQLRKLQVFTKHAPKLLPEQKEAASLFSIFVFQKTH
jgi:hypothetical protein